MSQNTSWAISYFCWFWGEIWSWFCDMIIWKAWILASHGYWCLHQMIYWITNAFRLL